MLPGVEFCLEASNEERVRELVGETNDADEVATRSELESRLLA